ncbi:N-acetyl-gamma-glutamyl-phosphate reductase [Sphingobium subterraneum]|uniref:N-acetyl-gamma-glutamyl-phosphate reductase n=1 Tax=Sphingobium subterraneum TaxID=627688 RepID=A0A841J4F4_9SPHN|nr:N-acetyl-gamma-glutamyl-phosphate reductase [Sphingobium subterraneum]MBB6123131.1 N-acetyl-gamma-glutamyl-phosphate reductase [Sphingobium subterraneum]
MTTQVFIDGAVGTTGLEIRDRLDGRSEFALITLDEAHRKDPSARRDALNAADVVILCLPDDAAREAVALIDNDRTKVIDASTAHRTAPGWTYGFPEVVGRDAVAASSRVSNPGCYSTGFIALVAPLVRAGLIPADWPLSANAVSGYSGGGKAMIAEFEDGPAPTAWRTYALTLAHKHVPEMQVHCGLVHAPIFAPSVANLNRGMIVDVPLPLAVIPGKPSPQAIHDALAQAYAGSRIVKVIPNGDETLLTIEQVSGTDRIELYVFARSDGSQARLVAAFDNLGKGASGAAVQNLNILAGLDEAAGLNL